MPYSLHSSAQATTLSLCLVVVVAVMVPIVSNDGEAKWDVRNALFVTVEVWLSLGRIVNSACACNSAPAFVVNWSDASRAGRANCNRQVRTAIGGRAIGNGASNIAGTFACARAPERFRWALCLRQPVPRQVAGREVDDILGKTDYDFYDRAIADKFRKDDLRVTRNGLIVDDIERTQQPDGTIAFMQVRKAPCAMCVVTSSACRAYFGTSPKRSADVCSSSASNHGRML